MSGVFEKKGYIINGWRKRPTTVQVEGWGQESMCGTEYGAGGSEGDLFE